jgi:hypothetical protein
LRPSFGWLETGVDFVDRIGDKEWCGHKVGMAGFASLQDWTLAMAGVWPGVSAVEVFNGRRDNFYAGGSPGWNDGYMCWRRLNAGLAAACHGDTSLWTRDLLQFKALFLDQIDDMRRLLHPMDFEQAVQKWQLREHWPINRKATCSWYPGAFMLINMDAWRKVGRFRDGCTFFEGHLGIRMVTNGYLSLCVESPLFLHCPSQGFSAASQGKTPRDHRDVKTLFLEDFGYDNMDAPNELCNKIIPPDKQKEINSELAKVELSLTHEWSKWL